VEIRLESVNNSNFIGTILYPKGNIAESLLREGLAKCVDWSMAVMKTGEFCSFLSQIRSSFAQHSTELVNNLLLCCSLFATGCQKKDGLQEFCD